MVLFVTGAGGFVGRRFVQAAKALGHQVVAVDIASINEQGYIAADISSPAIANIIPENSDAVVHLAAMSRDQDCKNKAHACFNANVMGTLNLIDAAQKKNVKQFIFASTEWVYDSFAENEVKDETSFIDISKITSEYALSKLVSEANLRQKYNNGFCPVTILRFGIIYGPRENNWSAVESLFNAVKTKETIEVGSLKTGRCFIHVSDIVSGIISALGLQGFHMINLQGNEFITLGKVIDFSKEILGRNPPVTEKSPSNSNARRVSNDLAKLLLHWAPQYDLRRGLESLQDNR